MLADKIPVTILTGFLGSGKTTLLNRVLSERHGLRIAVIENEYGEVGIDQGLVIDTDEEVFEMSNGCICCTVRGDLIRILTGLAKRRHRFDYVLVETTGLADPGPVAQTFFMDDDVREHYALDGIVTLVDARHLEPEYPFEWTGVWHLGPDATLDLGEGPDPSMSLVVMPLPDTADGQDEMQLRDGAERSVRLYAEPAVDVAPGGSLPAERHLRLDLDGPGRKRFAFDLPVPGRVALYAQHLAEEFDLRVRAADEQPLAPAIEHAWVVQHEHDDSVTSVAVAAPGDLDPERLNRWLSELLREQGQDIFRMKGFLSLTQGAGEAERFVFQGVHMLFDGRPQAPWGDAERGNQLVFIGRNLDRAGLEAGLRACLA